MQTPEELKKIWAKQFSPLVGRKIVAVRWMNNEGNPDWIHVPIILQLDDGTLLWPQSDDEGNDAGALGVQPGKLTKTIGKIAPVI